jgi:LCP family protein required for cell wall assembly
MHGRPGVQDRRSDAELLQAAEDEPEAFGVSYDRHVRMLLAFFYVPRRPSCPPASPPFAAGPAGYPISQYRPRFLIRSVTIEAIRPSGPPGGRLLAVPRAAAASRRGSVDAGGPPGWSRGPVASPPGTGRRGPRHAAPSRRRRLLVLVLAVALGAAAVVVAGGFGYAHWRFGQIDSVDLPGLSKPPPPGQPQVLLVVGSDSRAELDQPGDAAKFGTSQDAGGVRGDVIMLVRVDPAAHTVKVLSIPRDLLVPNAATGGRSKINAVFAGGPQLLIQTIQQYLGVPINHYLLVNFDGFRAIIDALGGIRMSFPYPAADDLSGLHITTAGCHRLGGDRALAVARSRHYRYQVDGTWRSDPLSDLGRIKRQQVFLRVVLQTALSKGLTNPVRANRFIGAVVGHLTKDRGLTQANAIGLARQFRGFDPNQLGDQTVPTVVANDYQGFGDVLLLDQAAAGQAIAKFLDRPPPTSTTLATAQQVSVRVQNATGISGLAAKTTSRLVARGVDATNAGNATPTSRTTIRYPDGQQQAATAVAAMLLGGARLVPDSSLPTGTVRLVLGTNYRGIRGAATPTTPAPQTTVTTKPEPPRDFDPRPC